MTAVRDARAAAVRRRWRDLSDDLARALPLLLDDLDAIDAAQMPREGAETAPGGTEAAPAVNRPPGGARAADGAAEAREARRSRRRTP